MSRYVFKLPDLGEGTVDAEIIAWRVKPGEEIAEDDPLVEMMTEKATVEVPAPVSGRVVSVRGEPGDKVPVGAELAVFETGEAVAAAGPTGPAVSAAGVAAGRGGSGALDGGQVSGEAGSRTHSEAGGRVLTSPAIRRRAREAGVDLTRIAGSGPHGRILREDFESYLAGGA